MIIEKEIEYKGYTAIISFDVDYDVCCGELDDSTIEYKIIYDCSSIGRYEEIEGEEERIQALDLLVDICICRDDFYSDCEEDWACTLADRGEYYREYYREY